MERLNKKTLSFPIKYFKIMVVALGYAVFLTACNKNGGSSANAIPPIYGFGCQNCAANLGNPVLLTTFQAQSADGNVILNNMQLFGQASRVIPNASGAIYKWYQGPVALQGSMTVSKPQVDYDLTTGQKASACVVPSGVYNLQTRLIGQMDLQGVNVIFPSIITSMAGIELKIEAPSPMGLLSEGRRFWGRVSIVRVNGIPCSPNFFGDFN